MLKADNKVERRLVTLGPQVWKAPAAAPGESPPGWVMVNPNPPPPSNGGPPPPTRRPVLSLVSIRAGLDATDRVIVDGVVKVRPMQEVAPQEWVLTPPK